MDLGLGLDLDLDLDLGGWLLYILVDGVGIPTPESHRGRTCWTSQYI